MTDVYTILLKYISGEATPDEAEAAAAWISASADNKKEFEEHWKIMELTSRKGNYQLPNVANEWATIQDKINPSNITPDYKNVLFGGGALFIIVIVLFFVFRPFGNDKVKMITRSSGLKTVSDTLLGDAMLFLDAQSSITYPEVLKQESFIKINGSVYIKDEHNKLNIVRLSAGEIEVIPERATFYISYDSAIGASEVHVQSGAVIIKHGQKEIKLEAGEAVRFGRTKNEMGEKIPFNINLYSYVTKVFDFRDTPLKEAIQSLEKGYGVTIKLNNPAMNNCRITTLLDNKTLRQILDIMAFTLNFEYDYSEADGVVLLSGKGCD